MKRSLRGASLIGAVFILIFSAPPIHAQIISDKSKNCPVQALCPKIEDAYQGCVQSRVVDCEKFVALFEKLIPTYDCRPAIESLPGDETFVPAITLCDAHQDFTLDDYLEKLSNLHMKSAEQLFASPKMRGILKGKARESYYDLSLEREHRMKKRRESPLNKSGERSPANSNGTSK